jgi:hypothetical protein
MDNDRPFIDRRTARSAAGMRVLGMSARASQGGPTGGIWGTKSLWGHVVTYPGA